MLGRAYGPKLDSQAYDTFYLNCIKHTLTLNHDTTLIFDLLAPKNTGARANLCQV